MKIFKNFICIILSALLVIPVLPVMAEPTGLATRETEFGEEYIIWEEDFDSAGATLNDYVGTGNPYGYSIGNNGTGVDSTTGVSLVANGSGKAIQVGRSSNPNGGTHFWLQKNFSEGWNKILSDGGITPKVNDYVIFSVDAKYAGNTWFFRSDQYLANGVAQIGKNMGSYGKGSGKPDAFRDAESKDIVQNISKDWHTIRVVYQYGANAIKHAYTIFDGVGYDKSVSGGLTYYDIPLDGLTFVQMRANWATALFDNIRISYVKNPGAMTAEYEFDSAAANPYYPIKTVLNRNATAGTATLMDGDVVIDSASAPGKELVLNSDGNLLDFNKEYTLKLEGIKDIFGNTLADATVPIKTLAKTNVPDAPVASSQMDNVSVLLASEPDAADLDSVKLCYSDGSGELQQDSVAGVTYDTNNGNYILNVPITENLRAKTTYKVTMNGAELLSFTTKDSVNVSRAAFSANSAPVALLSDEEITVSVDVDNETGYAGVSSAALMVMYFKGDRLVKLVCTGNQPISATSSTLSTTIDLTGETIEADCVVKTFVMDENMHPLGLSSVLRQ